MRATLVHTLMEELLQLARPAMLDLMQHKPVLANVKLVTSLYAQLAFSESNVILILETAAVLCAMDRIMRNLPR